jgi:RNA recognition motif-containing protein
VLSPYIRFYAKYLLLFISLNFFLMNIFIAGLSYNISDSDLGELFAEYGEVSSAKVITDRETGRSKGYGFVELADEAAGNKAIEELNGAEIDGKAISVSVARPKSDAPRRSSNGGGGYGGGSRGGNSGGGYGGGSRGGRY